MHSLIKHLLKWNLPFQLVSNDRWNTDIFVFLLHTVLFWNCCSQNPGGQLLLYFLQKRKRKNNDVNRMEKWILGNLDASKICMYLKINMKYWKQYFHYPFFVYVSFEKFLLMWCLKYLIGFCVNKQNVYNYHSLYICLFLQLK